MNLQRLKAIQASILRGGFCATWIASGVMAFYEFLYSVTAEIDNPEPNIYMIRSGICLIIFALASVAHSILLRDAKEKSDGQTD